MPLDPQAVADVMVLAIKTALAPVLADVAAVKGQLVTLEALRDRVVTVETKTLAPETTLSDLRERVVTLETRSAGPSVTDMAVVDLRERLTSVEQRARIVANPDDPAPEDDLAASLTGLLRKELGVLEPATRTQKRVVRDGHGAVKYEIEETR